jgi:hypothetical protein
VGLEGLPFGVGKIGLVAPVHARERTSPNYPARFSKQFRKVNSQKLDFRFTEFSRVPQSTNFVRWSIYISLTQEHAVIVTWPVDAA